jgi:hypothetical protein
MLAVFPGRPTCAKCGRSKRAVPRKKLCRRGCDPLLARLCSLRGGAGIDIPNDGEFGKPMRAASDRGAWGNYIFNRVPGFVPTPPESVAPDTAAPGAAMRIVGVRWEQREFAEFYADTGLGGPSTAASRPMCAGPIAYTGHEALSRDLANLRAAKSNAGVEEAFVASIAPRQSGDVPPGPKIAIIQRLRNSSRRSLLRCARNIRRS